MADRVLAGDVRVCIDRVVGLEDVPQALALHAEGWALGKVVVEVRPA